MNQELVEQSKWVICMTCSKAKGCYLIAESDECCKLRGVPSQTQQTKAEPLVEVTAKHICSVTDDPENETWNEYTEEAHSLLQALEDWTGEDGSKVVRVLPCPKCGGNGYVYGPDLISCSDCLGKGFMILPLVGKEGE
jgi:hypothetical protein